MLTTQQKILKLENEIENLKNRIDEKKKQIRDLNKIRDKEEKEKRVATNEALVAKLEKKIGRSISEADFNQILDLIVRDDFSSDDGKYGTDVKENESTNESETEDSVSESDTIGRIF